MAASNPAIQTRFQKAGLAMLSPKRGIQLLSQAVRGIIFTPTPVLAEVAWPQMLSSMQRVPHLFSEVVRTESSGAPAKLSTVDLGKAALLDAEGIAARVASIVAAMLGANPEPDQV